MESQVLNNEVLLIFLVGWMASFPFDCIKANIQGQPLEGKPRKIVAATKEIWQKRGIRGFYSGIGPSITRAFIVSSTRFSAYEFALSVMNQFVSSKT